MSNMHPALRGSVLPEAVVKETLHRVSKARVSLIRTNPFFATLALGMEVHITDAIPTAATNYTDMYFSPDFVAKLSDPELVFLVCHEVMHPMFHHNTRMKARNPMLWNVAADLVINEHLVLEGIGTMPVGGVKDTAIFTEADGVTETVYNLLQKKQDEQGGGKKGKGKGSPGGGSGSGIPDEAPWEDILQEQMTPAQEAQQVADMQSRVAQATYAAKMAGKLSANMQRLVGEVLNPKLDWRDVLRNFVFKARTDERSWSRPNRRFISQGLYTPSVSGEQMGEMLVAVDCSGSIGERELNEFAAEIRAIHEDCRPIRLHVVYFDSQVCHHDVFTREDTLFIKPHGGGGTAFSPVFRYAEKHGIDPVCCVFLTDLYCSDFGPVPGYPVLWVTNGTDQAPWGQVIKM